MSKEELTRRAGLASSGVPETKPILMQLLESFLAGDRSPAAPGASPPKENNQAP